MTDVSVDELLRLSDADLSRQCRFDAYRSRGPGGQKRNKTSSAVHMVHVPTGVDARSTEFRSQAENRVRALHRVRLSIAATMRTPIDRMAYEPPAWLAPYRRDGRLLVNSKNHDSARAAAHALDVLLAARGEPAHAAALLGVSTSSLLRFLELDEAVHRSADDLRRQFSLPPLRARG